MNKLFSKAQGCRISSIGTSLVRRRLRSAIAETVERLEPRKLLCMDHLIPAAENPKNFATTVIDTPDEIDQFLLQMVRESPTTPTAEPAGNFSAGDFGRVPTSPALGISPAVAPIVWVNRGVTSGTDNDRFNDVFGAGAGTARAVMDAAINMWARVIGAFNYAFPLGGSTYQLTVKMATGASGNGASASVTSWYFGKPTAGAITMGSGGNGLGSGWFIDPTPYDNSEFMGTIDNAFAGEAQSGSPALGKGDFLTVALAEMAHCMGLYFSPSLFQNNVTNTGIDDAAVGGTSTVYVHDTANVDHLMTEFDSGGGDTGQAVHTAEPQTLNNYSGRNWSGTDDAGNAYYSFSQRCLVPENLRLIFNDSLGYSTNAPSWFGSMYASLDSSGILQIRGGAGASVDVVSIDVSGTDLVVDVDVSADVAGSGSLSGAGDLPAWRHFFPLSSVAAISINGGDGTDYLRLERTGGKPVTINGGDGDDFIDFTFVLRNLDNIASGSIQIIGGNGYDQTFVYDNNNGFGDTYNITSARFDRVAWAGFSYAADIEALTLITGSAPNTVNIPSTYPGQPIFLNSSAGADTVNIGDSSVGMQSIRANVEIHNDPNFTTLNLNDTGDTTARTALVYYSGAELEYVTGLAPANVYFDRSDIQAVNLTTGSGADLVHVYDNSETLNIHNSAGSGDTVRVGDDSFIFSFPFFLLGDGLDGMTGSINIDNAPSFTTIQITDSFGSAARNATWSVASGLTTIAGLLPGGTLTYKNADTNTVTLDAGGYADTFTLNDFGRPTTINSAGGADTVTINGTAYGSTLTLDTGADDDTVNINESSTTVFLSTGAGSLDAVSVNADGVGAAFAQFGASDEIGILTVNAGGLLTLAAGHDKMLSISGANITGRIDVNDNAFLRRGAAAEGFYRTRLINGRNSGLWNGAQPSFMSTYASNSLLPDSLGYGLVGPGEVTLATLYGLPIVAGDLLIRYALNGDLNLDGTINFDDLLTMAQNYGAATGKRWSQGDVNYDGGVTFDDLLTLAQQYGNSAISIVTGMANSRSSRDRRIIGSMAEDSLLS